MTRKDASFRQLIDYVNKDAADARYVLTHNLLAPEPGDIAAEFEANARLLRQHANGTVMFHDIVSITRSKSLGLERQKEILKDIARDYITRRAPDHLVYAGLHEDHAKHLHYHFIISANPVGDWKRAHLSKPQLRTLQTDIERHVIAHYPDLEQQPTMARKARGQKVSQPGQELLRRTGKVPERQRITEALTAVFGAARDNAELFAKLTDARLELYKRGKSIGVRDLDTGRNHRLSTLGLDEAFKAMNSRFATASQTVAKPQQATPIKQTLTASQTSPTPKPKEADVDLLQAALQGVSALADALSITTDLGKPIDDQKRRVQSAAQTILKPTGISASAHTTRPPPVSPEAIETDAERIARERLLEIAEIRNEQDRQHSQSQDQRLKR
jgi:hypothetical protein